MWGEDWLDCLGTMEVETQKGVSGVRGAHLGRRGFIIPPVVPVLDWPGLLFWRIFLILWEVSGEGEGLGGRVVRS